MLHSIYDLTTYCRKTSGDVPAKLVGASTTVVGSKMYLFGGRLVSERRMVSDLYMFDLETFVWEKLPAFPEDDIPRPRYFHSTDAWNNHLVVFGGMSNQPDSINPDDLCVLNDVRFFNLATRHWLPQIDFPASAEHLIPRARYAHLSSVTSDRLFIIGGQDFFNTWLDDVCVFDLVSKTWIQRRDYPRHCGTYRSVAVCSTTAIRSPQDEMQASRSSSALGPSGSRFAQSNGPSASSSDVTPSEKLAHLPYSITPTEDHPSDIYLYSNYNFTDVKRELEIFSPLPDADFIIQDRSSAMTGSTFPPGLRFPTGAVLGSHLIIAGTYLAHSYQSFSIWVLDLTSMTWSRIDCGKAIETGSWFRGCLYPESNKFLIFGNKHANLVDDYNRRLLSWDYVAVVDLEAFGIYQPPPLKLDVRMQELGLAALEEQVLTDFELVCDDGKRIPCSRKVLEDRWPWFKEQRKQFLRKAKSSLETLPSSTMHVPLPELPGNVHAEDPRVDPRLTPRAFYLSEPYTVTLALLQYFYSLALITPLQHTPAVLSQLLILATNYRITHLESLVKHAMHRSLSNSTSVGVYEVATLCSCRSLQIRALKTVMSYTQRRPAKRSERDSGGGNAKHSDGGDGRDGGSTKYVSRPRGTSDAKWRNMTDSGASSSGYNVQNNNAQVDPQPRTQELDSSVHVANPTSTSPAQTAVAVPAAVPAASTAILGASVVPSVGPVPNIQRAPDSVMQDSVTPKAPPSIPAENQMPGPHIALRQTSPKPPNTIVPNALASTPLQSGSTAPPIIRGKLLRRPATADSQGPSPVIRPTVTSVTARPTILRPGTAQGASSTTSSSLAYMSSTEDIRAASDREWYARRGTPINKSIPNNIDEGGTPTLATFSRSRAGSGPSTMSSTPAQGLPYPHPPLSAVSAAPSTTASFLSDDRTLTTSVDMNFRESQFTAIESDAGTTDEEYHVLTKEDLGPAYGGTAESVYSGRSNSSSGTPQKKFGMDNWPKQASTVRWLEREVNYDKAVLNAPTQLPPPATALSSPPIVTSNPSSGSSFVKFLSRNKDRQPSQSEEDFNIPSPGQAGGGGSKLNDIKSQIANLEEERKRLKKEAKIRALLTQSGGPVAILGGGMMR